jgi:predicted Zn-dependent protease
LNANGQAGYLNDYRWEYKLVDDKAVNAWCMPGGKIVVYTGILPVTKDDAGLATVMGHEVSLISKSRSARMRCRIVATTWWCWCCSSNWRKKGAETQQLAMTALWCSDRIRRNAFI